MKYVAVSELKARLSEYLREVAKGVRLVVTDRGEPLAEIAAYGSPPPREETQETILRRLSQEGAVQIASRPRVFPKLKGRPRLMGGTASEILSRDRG